MNFNEEGLAAEEMMRQLDNGDNLCNQAKVD